MLSRRGIGCKLWPLPTELPEYELARAEFTKNYSDYVRIFMYRSLQRKERFFPLTGVLAVWIKHMHLNEKIGGAPTDCTIFHRDLSPIRAGMLNLQFHYQAFSFIRHGVAAVRHWHSMKIDPGAGWDVARGGELKRSPIHTASVTRTRQDTAALESNYAQCAAAQVRHSRHGRADS